jgi:hypothetical protein
VREHQAADPVENGLLVDAGGAHQFFQEDVELDVVLLLASQDAARAAQLPQGLFRDRCHERIPPLVPGEVPSDPWLMRVCRETGSEETRDVIEILSEDHREVEAMFVELEMLLGTCSGTGGQGQGQRGGGRAGEAGACRGRGDDEAAGGSGSGGRVVRGCAAQADAGDLPTCGQGGGRDVRSHPGVPNDPEKRLAAGPVTGLFDRLRDMASGRGTPD